jgi:hypothetical protein
VIFDERDCYFRNCFNREGISMHAKNLKVVLRLGLLVLASFSLGASAQDLPPRAELITEVQHAVSPPVRNIPRERPVQGQVLPWRHPLPPPTEAPNDPVVQRTTTGATSSHSTIGGNITGISADGYIPPDTNLSVGRAFTDSSGTKHDGQMVQIVNVEYSVYDKSTGTQLTVPSAIHTIFQALGTSNMCATQDGGDPVVLYDKINDRWLISQLAYNSSLSNSLICVAVSTTADATGSYNVYSFSFGRNFPDYPKFAIWPDGYYLSANTFKNGTRFSGAKACALNSSAMLAGSVATGICFQLSSSVASLLPSDLDGSTLPPSGEPNFYLNFVTNGLNLYRFHVASYSTTTGSTFSGPYSVGGVAAFSTACGGGTCVPQPGTSQQLDSLGDRLMFRLAYRNFPNASTPYESLVVNHSVRVSSLSNQTGVRWYEIHSPAGTPTVFQQGTYAPDITTYRWMGSIAQDHLGDMVVGYSVSAPSSVYPGIRYAGRLSTDTPLGTLEAENTIVDGSASQTGSYSYRWGDYSSMSIDPDDDCTFWYTTEYLTSGGSFNWNTYIASFKFSACP